MAEDKEMSFLDHLEELRWHLIRSVAAIAIFGVLAFVFPEILFSIIIFGPSKTDFVTYKLLCEAATWLQTPSLCIEKLPFILQSRTLSGQFTMHVTGSLVAGLICGFPYVFWEIWRFVSPGLHIHERQVTRGVTFVVSVLFLIGVSFGYFIVTPLSINFLANYQIDPTIQNEYDIVSYISTVCMLVLACGVMFQMPIIVYFLTKIGLVTPKLMREYYRHAILGILVVAAVITPPDVFSQLLVAFPMLFLYQISIYISAYVVRKKQKETIA